MDDLKRALDALTQIERETFQGHGEQPKRWNRLAMDAMESLHAARRAALAAAWVRVAERVPEERVEVLVHDGFHQRLIATLERGKWRDAVESMPLDYVTHWQPLPPLPSPPKD